VKEVRQLDDTHVHWHAEIWGKEKEWDAEIIEQEPDKRISWKSISGAPNAGTVRFEPRGAESTRVRLTMAYEPEGLVDQDARQAPFFRAGKDSADSRSCCERQSGVFCCSMYWRTMLMGAPPQEEAK